MFHMLKSENDSVEEIEALVCQMIEIQSKISPTMITLPSYFHIS